MLTLITGLFVLTASLYLLSGRLKPYKYPIAGFLLMLFVGIQWSIFSAGMTGFEKLGWSVVTTLELVAVPFLLVFLVEERSVPKMIALILGGGLVMLAQELREGQMSDHELMVHVMQEAHPKIKSLSLDPFYLEKAFDPEFAESTTLDDYYHLKCSSVSNAKFDQIIDYLLQHEWILNLEKDDEIYRTKPIFTESSLIAPPPSKSQLKDPLAAQQWGLHAVRLSEAFSLLEKAEFSPKRKSKVVVLDTGIKGDHEDLKGNLFKIDQNKLVDKNGHGTHCAGTIGASNNNGKGINSFNYQNKSIEVSGIAVLNDQGIGRESKIVNGIIEAVDAGADVISMSLGGLSNPLKQSAYRKAIKYAESQNVIIVAAAGNSAANAKYYLPTSMDYVFSVSAVDSALKLAKFSNTVQDVTKGLAAPGVQVLSTDEKGTYKSANGTSMAAPFVSGLIALMRSIDPEVTADEVYRILSDSGLELNHKERSGNLIQADKAIELMLEHQNH